MSCRQRVSVPFSRKLDLPEIGYRKVISRPEIAISMLQCDIMLQRVQLFLPSSRLPRFLIADLRHFGKSLQQPRQRHFQPDMIVRHIEMA